jgi:hypothetical protein
MLYSYLKTIVVCIIGMVLLGTMIGGCASGLTITCPLGRTLMILEHTDDGKVNMLKTTCVKP